MEKIIDILMEQAEDCLRKYSEKQNWSPNDLEPIKYAVSIYDKLQNIAMKCEKDERQDPASFRSYGMRHMTPHYSYGRTDTSYRNPRYYEYDGSLTSYGDREYAMRHSPRMSYGDTRSTHSIEDRMVASLERMMDEAKSDYERDKILEFINLAKARENR